MNRTKARKVLGTHIVTNQPPPFENLNIFTTDHALEDAVGRFGNSQHRARLVAFGERCGSSEVADWAAQANANPPRLKAFNRYGERIDEVEFHPAYHWLMGLGIGAGVSAAAWSGLPGGHVLHAGLEFLMAQAEPGVCCPMTMTYAAPAVLKNAPGLSAQWLPKITGGQYDSGSAPLADKAGATIGMAMTEKQGGSDIRSNTTRAQRMADGNYVLVGHKWFCSAPMSDAFVTLAQSEKGLSCFLAPRWTPAGERNAIELMRLKDKLGDRSNASAEIEYHSAYAVLIGEEGQGIRTIMDMVQHTRLDCTVAPSAYMRQALANALWHTAHRTAFGKQLIDQPLMRSVLADLIIESEAATALTFRIAQSFDAREDNEGEAAFARIATPIGKYWINKRVIAFVAEAMEAHGGAGYIEESVMPRIYRQSPLNSIWEGSGNVICLDILRALHRDKRSGDVLIAELESAPATNAAFKRAIEDIKDRMVSLPDEAGARLLAERLALALQAATLLKSAPDYVSDAFCATRLEMPGLSFGALDAKIDSDSLITRATPIVS